MTESGDGAMSDRDGKNDAMSEYLRGVDAAANVLRSDRDPRERFDLLDPVRQRDVLDRLNAQRRFNGFVALTYAVAVVGFIILPLPNLMAGAPLALSWALVAMVFIVIALVVMHATKWWGARRAARILSASLNVRRIIEDRDDGSEQA